MKLYKYFYASKGYEGGSLSELESSINRAASESGMTLESIIAAKGKEGLDQVFLEGDQSVSVSPSASIPPSVIQNRKSFISTSDKSIPQEAG